MKPTDARWFPKPELFPAPQQPGAHASPTVEQAERAQRIAQAAMRLMAGWLANPGNEMASVDDVGMIVRVAMQIEEEAKRAIETPGRQGNGHGRAPSPQALAWRAGYLDAELGRPARFRGPPELEPDYRDGMARAAENRTTVRKTG